MTALALKLGLPARAAMGGAGGISLSALAFPAGSAQGTAIGILSVVGAPGTFTFTLSDSGSNKVQVAGTNGVNLQAGSASASASTFNITVHADNGAGITFDRTFAITAWSSVSNSVAPAITGSAVQGVTLSVSNGTWSGFPAPSFTYQWKRAGVAITGATNSTYTLVSADVGSAITCTVTANNGFSNASATSSATGSVTKTTLSYTPVTSATQNSAYTGATPSPSNGTAPYTYSIGGTLPTALSLNTSTGVISGTPTTAQTASGLVLVVTDANSVSDSSASFSITVAAAGVGTPASPAITVTSAGNDNTPDFAVDIPFGNGAPLDAVAGDVLTIEAKLGAGSYSTYITHTLTAPEIAGASIPITGVTPLTDGAYTYRAKLSRSGSDSAYSSTASNTIDTTGPTLSSPTGTKTGSTTATLSVTTNEASGTEYWVLTGSATPPSAAQVKAGQNHLGAAALKAGSQAVSATGAQPTSVTALTASTTYFAYFMHEDAATNQSTVSAASSFTTDATPAMQLDNSRKGANITLSGSPLLTAALSTNTFYANVFGNGSGKSSGKYCFEMTLNTIGIDGQGMGIANASVTTSEIDGGDVTSIAWRFGNGDIRCQSVRTTIQAAAQGQTCVCAADLDNRLIWFRSTGSTNWNNNPAADPATGVGGIAIPGALTFPVKPMATLEITSDNFTFNFGGSAYALTKPAGFSDWT